MLISFIVFSLFSGFSFQDPQETRSKLPKGFPEVIYPEGNEHTQERWALGKKLFFDPIMSDDGSISCSSCHAPELAFSDDLAMSIGVGNTLGTQNAPSLTNVAYHPYFTRAGGVPTLEMQILVPIQEHNEFNSNIIEIAERMSNDEEYVAMSQAAYERGPDAFVITRALACFERSLISGNSPYDRYTFHKERTVLNVLEKEGMELFFSERAQCSSCHGGFNFTDYSFQNNGLYIQYPDSGKLRFTRKESDRALFKVPSLRNNGFTAPYMHDGSIASIEEVLDHYSEGIRKHENLSSQLKAFHFSKKEKKQLIAFLGTLNDPSFVQDPRFKQDL
ncbi:MAG: cytochrome-c peroxidase [Flavobacteriales bacterium]|nr:cytochrome-c peroxidase [Flavobacteriales bacterium]